MLLLKSDIYAALRGMFYVHVCFILCRGVSWGGLGILLLTCKSHGYSLESAGIEKEEVIREPARIEDGCLGSFPSLTLDGVSMYGC